jgi:hypothetical protein
VRFGARDYDPTIGRWLTKDPLGFAAGINFYAFCGNDPVNKIDPSGLDNLYLGGKSVGQNSVPPGVDSSGNVTGGGQTGTMVNMNLTAVSILGAFVLAPEVTLLISEATLYVAATSPLDGLILTSVVARTLPNTGQMINAINSNPYIAQFVSGLTPLPGGPFASWLEAGSWFAGFVLSGGAPSTEAKGKE